MSHLEAFVAGLVCTLVGIAVGWFLHQRYSKRLSVMAAKVEAKAKQEVKSIL